MPVQTGQTITVNAGDNLQNALNSAQPGDTIVLEAGVTFTGNFTLPAKSNPDNKWIVVKSSKESSLPPQGVRVKPSDAVNMPKIVGANGSYALAAAAGSSNWRLTGLEITLPATFTGINYGLLMLGELSAPQTSLASVPKNFVVDRNYIHGYSNVTVRRCIALHSANTAIIDSALMECHEKGADSQAIWGSNGPGPYKISNNLLQGAGENVMFGGNDPAIPNLVPSDIEITRNHFYTPVAWKGVWTKKNLLELKNAARVLVEGNVFDGSWTDGQQGWAVMFRSANQDGDCRWCRTTDVTFRRNYITNAAGGVNVIGGTGVDTTARRILVSEVVMENIGVAPYTGDQRGLQFNEGPADIIVERSVLTGNLNLMGWMSSSVPTQGLVLRDNVMARGMYGLATDGTPQGIPSLQSAAPGYVWSNMTLIGSSVNSYPPGTAFISNESQAPLAAQIRSIVSAATSGAVSGNWIGYVAPPLTPTPVQNPTPIPTPTPTWKFKVGDAVRTTDGVNVRSSASLSAPSLGTQSSGIYGTVTGGPIAGNGYTWWQINYVSAPDGWSVEDYLVYSGSIPTPTPAPAPTPTPTPSPETTSGIAIGDWIQTTTGVNVRTLPSTSAERVGGQNENSSGTIVAGPISANGYTWWQVNFTSGADGWVVGNYLH